MEVQIQTHTQINQSPTYKGLLGHVPGLKIFMHAYIQVLTYSLIEFAFHIPLNRSSRSFATWFIWTARTLSAWTKSYHVALGWDCIQKLNISLQRVLSSSLSFLMLFNRTIWFSSRSSMPNSYHLSHTLVMTPKLCNFLIEGLSSIGMHI